MNTDQEASTLYSSPLLERLKKLVDPTIGLPLRSHRAAPIGLAIMTAKQVMRVGLRPVIVELLAKQRVFNNELLAWATASTRDIEALERSMLATRMGLETRLGRLEAAVARLEQQVSPTAGTVELPGRNKPAAS